MSTPIHFSFTDAAGTLHSNTATLSDGSSGTPVIVLLHGLGGSESDWTNPAYYGYHFDRSAPWPPNTTVGTFNLPAVGFAGPPVKDPFRSIKDFSTFLSDRKFQTLVYSQIDPADTLARPALELAALMHTLHSLPGLSERRFVLLCHSRGGLLARQFLKDNKDDPGAVGRIIKVITLHSPHHGSRWGNEVTSPGRPTTTMAAAFDAALNSVRPGTGPVVATLLAPLISYTTTPAYLEMRVDGPFINGLESGETALPGVEYHTFGGTSVDFTRLIDRIYTLSSAVPTSAGFVHVITSAEDPAISPVFSAFPTVNKSNETRQGLGDFLVTDESSRLPFEHSHHTNWINHVEALFDPIVQQEVFDILNESDVWADWSVHGGDTFENAGRPRLVRDEFDRLLLFAGSFDRQWRRELAHGDAVPPGTSTPSAGEATGWSNWANFEQGLPVFGFAADFDNLPDLGGHRTHVFSMGAPAVALSHSFNNFQLATPQNVWTRLRGAEPDDWSSWTDIGGTIYGPSDFDPDITVVYSTLQGEPVCVRNAAREVEVFALGHDAKVWTAHELSPEPPNSFSNWEQLPITLAQLVTAILDNDNALMLFGYVYARMVCYRRRPDNGVWEEWMLPDEPGLTLSVAISDSDDRVVLLARDADGLMRWTCQQPAAAPARGNIVSTVWRGFIGVLVSVVSLVSNFFSGLFGGGTSGPRQIRNRWSSWISEDGVCASSLSAEQNADGSLAVVARGNTGDVVYRVQSEPLGDWTPWQSLGGDIRAAPVVGRLADGKLAVLALSNQGHLRQRTQINPGEWE
jgi:pimeloyl-ACP methyl ester carboxylesterase